MRFVDHVAFILMYYNGEGEEITVKEVNDTWYKVNNYAQICMKNERSS